MTEKIQNSVPALQRKAGQILLGSSPQKGNRGCEDERSSLVETSSLGKEMSQPVSQPAGSAFILVLFHLTAPVCLSPFPPKPHAGKQASRQPRQSWLSRASGCEHSGASFISPSSFTCGPHLISHPHG